MDSLYISHSHRQTISILAWLASAVPRTWALHNIIRWERTRGAALWSPARSWSTQAAANFPRHFQNLSLHTLEVVHLHQHIHRCALAPPSTHVESSSRQTAHFFSMMGTATRYFILKSLRIACHDTTLSSFPQVLNRKYYRRTWGEPEREG